MADMTLSIVLTEEHVTDMISALDFRRERPKELQGSEHDEEFAQAVLDDFIHNEYSKWMKHKFGKTKTVPENLIGGTP